MKVTIKISLPALLILVFAGSIQAQINKYNEEITIIAPYDPIIPDAFKLNQNPSSVDTATTKPKMNYQVNVNPLNFKPDLATLAPTKLANEPQEKLQRNYIKAGAGNYSSFYGELFAGSLRSKKHLVAFNLKHRSTLGKIDDYLDPGNDRTQGTFLAEKYLNKTVLSADLDAFRRVLHYYGLNTLSETLPDKDTYKQRFFGAGGTLGVRSANTGNQRVNYWVKAGYHYLEDINKNLEHNVTVDMNINKGFKWFRKADYQLYSVGANVNYVGAKKDLFNFNSLIYKVNPTAEVHFGEYSIKAGLNLNITDDSITKPYLFPQLEAAVQFADEAVRIYIGMDGGVKQNTLAGLIKTNEFMSSNTFLSFTYEKFKIYGGFKTNISKNFNLNASISHSTLENISFFDANSVTSFSYGPTYGLLFDDGTLLNISAAFNWLKSERLTMILSGEYNKYDLDTYEHQYFVPEYVANLGARYAINSKLTCKLNATYHSFTYSNYIGQTDPPQPFYMKMKGWFDESIGAEYKFNKSLSFWLDLNNVAAQRYVIWNDYPSYKFNFLAGAAYAF